MTAVPPWVLLAMLALLAVTALVEHLGPVGPITRARRLHTVAPDDGWLVTHAEVLALLPAEVRADFERPTRVELAHLHDVVRGEQYVLRLAGIRDPHAAHVLFAYNLWAREGHVGGWLVGAEGMGQRHGTSSAAVELADALRRATA
jgi:hypothetical protein